MRALREVSYLSRYVVQSIAVYITAKVSLRLPTVQVIWVTRLAWFALPVRSVGVLEDAVSLVCASSLPRAPHWRVPVSRAPFTVHQTYVLQMVVNLKWTKSNLRLLLGELGVIRDWGRSGIWGERGTEFLPPLRFSACSAQVSAQQFEEVSASGHHAREGSPRCGLPRAPAGHLLVHRCARPLLGPLGMHT